MTVENSRNLAAQESVNRVAIRRAVEHINRTGRALPCRVTAVDGSIVTVAFEIQSSTRTLPPVTIPKMESQWFREPTQVGDFGMTVPADAYLGGVSGLGGGTATLRPMPNLSALAWRPIASKSFSSVDPNAALVCGPNGAVIRDEGSTAVITLIPGQITLAAGGVSAVITETSISLNAPTIYLNGNVAQAAGTSAGTVTMVGPLTVTNEVTANSVKVSQHLHSDAGGSGDSGPPVPGS